MVFEQLTVVPANSLGGCGDDGRHNVMMEIGKSVDLLHL